MQTGFFSRQTFKQALFCGMGLAMDLSGSAAVQATSPRANATELIGGDFQRVGDCLWFAIRAEVQDPERLAASTEQLELKGIV